MLAATVSGFEAILFRFSKWSTREEMKKLYYDEAKYDTYLEQLGI